MQIQKGLVQVLLQNHGGFHGMHSFTPLIWVAYTHPGRGRFCSAGFQETFDTLRLLLSQLVEEATHTLWSYIVVVVIEAKR